MFRERSVLALVLTFFVTVMQQLSAAPIVTNVVARPLGRSADKVDVSFEVLTDKADDMVTVQLQATDVSTGKKIKVMNVTSDSYHDVASGFVMGPGPGSIVWDVSSDVHGVALSNVKVTVKATLGGPYMVVDLDKGGVQFLRDVPEGGWTWTHATTNLVMRKIGAGEDPLGRYSLTKDYYIGIYELSYHQFCRLCVGKDPRSFSSLDAQWNRNSTSYEGYDNIRAIAHVPTRDFKDRYEHTFHGFKNGGTIKDKASISKGGLDGTWGMPTEAQWEFACRAGSATRYAVGETTNQLESIALYGMSQQECSRNVGTRLPNCWGLYDMLGNVDEMTSDGKGNDLSGDDPENPITGDYQDRLCCGGTLNSAGPTPSERRYYQDRFNSFSFAYYPSLVLAGYRMGLSIATNNVSIASAMMAQVKAPVVSPGGRTVVDGTLTVTMSCATEGAIIYYTRDGSEPTTNSVMYSKFKIKDKTTVKAFAYKDGVYSDVVTAEYALGQCVDPVITPMTGTFHHSGQVVRIDQNGEEGTLRYTLDGSDPTVASKVYTGPFTVDDSVVVKAKVFSDSYFDSVVVTSRLERSWERVPMPVVRAASSFTGSVTKVELMCDAKEAEIRYTLDGTEPNGDSPRYAGAFYVNESCTVKAYAALFDYLDSVVVTQQITRVWGVGDTMGCPDHTFTVGGDVPFHRVEDVTAPNGEAMRSGEISDNQMSVLETKVMGPGTLSFQWKTSCELDEDGEFAWDHAEVLVDGTPLYLLDGSVGWTVVRVAIAGAGEHTVVWRYVKDESESVGEDCVWIADFTWTSNEAYTHESEVPVPYAWIRAKLPHTPDEYAAYESAVKEFAANGHDTVEACYVAGLDPADAQSVFQAKIKMEDGQVCISWTPNLNTGTVTRIYTVYGRTDLETGAWEPVQPWCRFFKVTVSMPTGKDGEETAVSGEGFVPEPELGGVQLWKNGPYWAECNVGATKPEEFGYYFWWGDTVGYRCVDDRWFATDGSPYEFRFYSGNCPTYYMSNSSLLNYGYIDAIGDLAADYDAATEHIGAPWRMPTEEDFSALVSNCNITWTTINDVRGLLVTGKGSYASRRIFLPAGGWGYEHYRTNLGYWGKYWSSTPALAEPRNAWAFSFSSVGTPGLRDTHTRDLGYPIRPVRGLVK